MTETQEEVKPMDKGPWWRRKGEVYIFSDDFKHDVKMKVDGDWGNAKEPYLDWLVDHLNRTTEEALRARVEELEGALKTILVASEFNSQPGVSDHVMRYAHESTARLASKALNGE